MQRLDPWRLVVSVAAEATRPFPAALAAAWRDELDAVQERVESAERAVPIRPGAAPDGTLALVCLIAARLGSTWLPDQLVDAAAAVELADRAIRHHAGVTDLVGSEQVNNEGPVLDGDLSITRAASLAAAIGPGAYRALVRGYGCVQLATLADRSGIGGRDAPRVLSSIGAAAAFDADPRGLVTAAVSLGRLVAGCGQAWSPGQPADAARLRRVASWASGLCSLAPAAVTVAT